MKSVWNEKGKEQFPEVTYHVRSQVAIIGGGVTGLTAAYLLAREGIDVALYERKSLRSGESSRTTAHLTCITDTSFSVLAS